MNARQKTWAKANGFEYDRKRGWRRADGNTVGYVTSAHHSPTLGRTVALGIVAAAQARQGEEVTLFYGGATRAARLVKPGAYDPAGDALNG